MYAKFNPSPEAVDDRLARRNAIVLAVTQALAGANNSVIIATGGIVGAMLAPDRSLATLPITIYVLGLWSGALVFVRTVQSRPGKGRLRFHRALRHRHHGKSGDSLANAARSSDERQDCLRRGEYRWLM
jgi:hypothetical protein